MEINNKDIIEKDDDIKIIDIKNTEEFKKNLDMILNQTIIDKERASFLLEKNNNDVFNTLIEILDESKSEKKNTNLQHSFEPKTDEDHKNNILELRNIMKEKDKMFNDMNNKK